MEEMTKEEQAETKAILKDLLTADHVEIQDMSTRNELISVPNKETGWMEHFHNGVASFFISFYDPTRDQTEQAEELKRKNKKWTDKKS